jgi:hypothetical protein
MTKLCIGIFLLVMTIRPAPAGAGIIEGCDTLHTSDTRGIWRCGDACVRRWGNEGDRGFTIGREQGRTGLTDKMTFVVRGNTVMMNGKRCKPLPQTFDYEEAK